MTHFVIHDSTGALRARIPAADAMLAGMWDVAARRLIMPDVAALRAALPHRWRAALDRGGARFWYAKDSRLDADGRMRDDAPYLALRGCRGRHLTTLYAIAASDAAIERAKSMRDRHGAAPLGSIRPLPQSVREAARERRGHFYG